MNLYSLFILSQYIELDYGLDDRRSISHMGLLGTASRLALGPTQPLIQWVPGSLTPAVKWPGREADH